MKRIDVKMKGCVWCAVLLFAVAFPLAVFAGGINPDSLIDEARIQEELHPKKYVEGMSVDKDSLWHADVLGHGYEARYVPEGRAWDGPVGCTVIRRLCPEGSHKAVLYVHGFNDYFFQTEMGERYNERGINFYAVDLRRYGRSLSGWQYPFDVRDFKEYFVDFDSALDIIKGDGNVDVTLVGHSTGGLSTALYAARRGARCGVRRLVLDSPFLQWNFNGLYRHVLLPAVTLWGAVAPGMEIKQGACDAYAESLLKPLHGEWEYDTSWKMIYSPPVKAGWIRAVSRAQSDLLRRASHITVPVLVLHSSNGLHSCDWTEACQTADVVLDPKQISERGKRLGRAPEVTAVGPAVHDVILSERAVRDNAYEIILDFISAHK